MYDTLVGRDFTLFVGIVGDDRDFCSVGADHQPGDAAKSEIGEIDDLPPLGRNARDPVQQGRISGGEKRPFLRPPVVDLRIYEGRDGVIDSVAVSSVLTQFSPFTCRWTKLKVFVPGTSFGVDGAA